jgi:hypothetical protein
LEATVDVHTMGDAAGARKILETGQTKDAKTVQLGDAGVRLRAERDLPQRPYLVRIVAYESTPDTPQALLALAHGVEAKL